MSNIEPLGRLTVLVCIRSPSKKSSIQVRFSVTPRMMPAAFLIVATNSSPLAWPDSSPAKIFSEIFLPFANFAALRKIGSFRGMTAIVLTRQQRGGVADGFSRRGARQRLANDHA